MSPKPTDTPLKLLWRGRSATLPPSPPPEVSSVALLRALDHKWVPTADLVFQDDAPGNNILYGDNLASLGLLSSTHKDSVDLVYIDPPFASGVDRKQTDRSVIHKDVVAYEERDAYHDTWRDGLSQYLSFMEPRLQLIHEVLSQKGSLLLHCDYRTSPYLSILCDEIFGMGAREPGGAKKPGYRNEIIWHYGLGGSSPLNYPRKHDVILWYSKGSAWTFEPPMIPATSQRLKGKLKKCPDVWHIPSINNMAKERTGYPTQKPLALLERIVLAHTEPDDLILDAFMGSGTTLIAAEKAGRRWIGCDAGAPAVQVVQTRLMEIKRSRPVALFEIDKPSS